jgi:hypothetical protein
MRRFQTHALIGLLAALVGSQLETAIAYFGSTYAEDIAAITRGYCMAPENLRVSLREVIEVSAAPNKIRVECAADAL